MESRRLIAAFLAGCFLLAGCSTKNTIDDTTGAESGVTTEVSEKSESSGSETSLPSDGIDRSGWVDDGDGSQFISNCHFESADKFQNGGYIPLKPEDVQDYGVREYAKQLYAKGYSLCSLEYMGYAMCGCALIDPPEGSSDIKYFNDGISAELTVNDGAGDVLTNEYYFIRMTEDQFNSIMLYTSSVNNYIYGNDFSPVSKDYQIPAGTDDGVVRRITSPDGHYIEYHRDTGICILFIDYTVIKDPEPVSSKSQKDKTPDPAAPTT